MPYDHTIPEFCFTIRLSNKSRRMKNGVLNGVPFYYFTRDCVTKMYPTTTPTLRLPFIVFGREEEDDADPFHVTFGIPYTYQRECILAGQTMLGEFLTFAIPHTCFNTGHSDAFESTPKIQCGIDIGDDGFFLACISLDLMTVYSQIRGSSEMNSLRLMGVL